MGIEYYLVCETCEEKIFAFKKSPTPIGLNARSISFFLEKHLGCRFSIVDEDTIKYWESPMLRDGEGMESDDYKSRCKKFKEINLPTEELIPARECHCESCERIYKHRDKKESDKTIISDMAPRVDVTSTYSAAPSEQPKVENPKFTLIEFETIVNKAREEAAVEVFNKFRNDDKKFDNFVKQVADRMKNSDEEYVKNNGLLLDDDIKARLDKIIEDIRFKRIGEYVFLSYEGEFEQLVEKVSEKLIHVVNKHHSDFEKENRLYRRELHRLDKEFRDIKMIYGSNCLRMPSGLEDLNDALRAQSVGLNNVYNKFEELEGRQKEIETLLAQQRELLEDKNL